MTIEMKMDLRFEEGLAEGEKIGRIEGEKIGRLGILSTMLASGMEKDTILKAGFTEEEIESLNSKP